MTFHQIESQCRTKAQELLEKHFGNLIQEAAIERPESIGDYSPDLPKQIEAEYSNYLRNLWAEIAPSGSLSFEEIIDKKHLSDLMTDDDREVIPLAYHDAITITWRERLAKSNHKQVTYYKGLLKRYTEDLLTALRCDFMEDIRRTINTSTNMNSKTYTPNPIDTTDVELSEELLELVELLAENTHDNWAAGRIAEGWTYGPVRNDGLKQHPCLIPYNELPDNEKKYDRVTSMETLKAIRKLGWKIEKNM